MRVPTPQRCPEKQRTWLAGDSSARAGPSSPPAGHSAAVLDFKADVLASHWLDMAHRVPVVADLTGDWASSLPAAGFRPDLPTVWVVEGLLMYLDSTASARLIQTVRNLCAPGSRIAVEYPSRTPNRDDMAVLSDEERELTAMLLTLFAGGPGVPDGSWLAGLGVTPARTSDVASEIRGHGRPLPPILSAQPGANPFVIWLADGTLDAD